LPIRTREGTVPASVSVGLALRTSGGPISASNLIECADEALYESKRKGRNCVTLRRIKTPPSER